MLKNQSKENFEQQWWQSDEPVSGEKENDKRDGDAEFSVNHRCYMNRTAAKT